MTISLSGMSLHTNNDNEGNWSGTDGADTYNNAVQGNNSESWLVSKNATETGTLTLSSTLNATRGIFTFWMSSNLAPYYTSIDLELQSSTNNYKNFECANSTNKAIGGDFVATAVDYVNKGTETGTFAPGSFSVLRIIVDNSTSGNIRSVINNWIDAMYYGPGHTISGTTTTDKLFAEAAAVDELVANKYGVMWNYNGIIYSQGDIDLSGTALTSDSETLVFVDTVNGYDTYNLDVTGTVTFKNTVIIAAGTIDFNFDTSAGTAFTMNGGSLSGFNTLTTKAGNTINGAVFQAGGTGTIANTIESATFNGCDKQTVSGAGEFDGCTFNASTDTAAVSVADLNDVPDCVFVKGTSGHAVELTGAAGTYAWDAIVSGYDTGSSGSDVANTGVSITGDEAIHCTATTGTIIINVSATATVPSVSSAGATVNVVAGQKTFTFNVNPAITGYEWRIYDVTATGSLVGAIELDGEESATSSSQSYQYSYTSDDAIAVQIIKPGDYEESITYYTLGNTDQTVTINLQVEENQ